MRIAPCLGSQQLAKLMISEVSLVDVTVAAEIHAVARAAYAIEAAVIGCPDFPPLRESLAALRESGDRFLIFRDDGVLVGVLSFACDDGVVRISRLVVSPTHHRQGVASALLLALERMVDSRARFTVSTARDNIPAIRLYEVFGYAVVSATNSREGIPLVHFTKCESDAAR